VVEHFVEREFRPKLLTASDDLRLSEDLGIDSLTMMEIVMVAEDALHESIPNEELCQLRTLGDLQAFILARKTGQNPGGTFGADSRFWASGVVTKKARRNDPEAGDSISQASN
jgi:acyl carrier protein